MKYSVFESEPRAYSRGGKYVLKAFNQPTCGMAVAAECTVGVNPHCWLSSLSFAGKEDCLNNISFR